jgi:hypothetical protein
VLFAYVEVPEQTRKFIELYRRVISAFDLARLSRVIISAQPNDPDLLRACQAIIYGATGEREVAAAWLAGGNPSLAELRSLAGITARIDDDVRATDKLISIINALRHQGVRTVICFDEFQRLSLHNQRDGLRVMQSLRTVLSQCPNGLAIVLAIASRAEQTAMDQLPLELKTLVGIKPAISLPPLTEEEGLQFLKERMSSFRAPDFVGDPFAPFGEDGARAIVSRVSEINDGHIGPRDILQAAGWALNQLGPVDVRDAEQLQDVLAELTPER